MSTVNYSCYDEHDDRCGECSDPTNWDSVVLDDFGRFHRECIQSCACGWLWPWSLVSSGDVAQYCDGCAHTGGESNDAA